MRLREDTAVAVLNNALRYTRSFVSANTWVTNKTDLIQAGLNKRAADYLFENRVLWLVRCTSSHFKVKLDPVILKKMWTGLLSRNCVLTWAMHLCSPPNCKDISDQLLLDSSNYWNQLNALLSKGFLPADDSPVALFSLLKQDCCPLFYEGETGTTVRAQGPFDPDEVTPEVSLELVKNIEESGPNDVTATSTMISVKERQARVDKRESNHRGRRTGQQLLARGSKRPK